MEAGIGYVPEDRKSLGIFHDMDVKMNLCMAVIDRFSRGPFVDRSALRRVSAAMRDSLSIKMQNVDAPMRSLSGGNQQKVLISRWLALKPSILLMNEPTRGVDVGAKKEIVDLILALAGQGYTFIVSSSELEELIPLSDRIIVMNRGRVIADFRGAEATKDGLILAATTSASSGRSIGRNKDMEIRNGVRASAFQRLFGLRDFGVLVAALLIAAFFSIVTPVFLTPYNIFNVLRQTAELGIIAMAMTVLIFRGEFDLSVGAIYAVTGVVTGLLATTLGLNIWLAALAGVVAALVLGFLNGLLIATTRINSFIATLSTMMVFRGIAMVLSQGQPISFQLSFFMDLFGRAELGGMLPVPVLWFAGWGIVMYVVLHRTTFGVKVFATGDNREAADLAGIRTMRIKRTAFSSRRWHQAWPRSSPSLS